MRAFCPPKNEPEKDLVMTPDWLAKDIINHYHPRGLVLDPCRGHGEINDNYPLLFLLKLTEFFGFYPSTNNLLYNYLNHPQNQDDS